MSDPGRESLQAHVATLEAEIAKLRAQRDELLAALRGIAAMKGCTLLGPDSRHHMGDAATCYHEHGANSAFEQCADIAAQALAKHIEVSDG